MLLAFLALRGNLGLELAFFVDKEDLRVVFRSLTFKEGVVCHAESESVQPCELYLEVWCVFIYHWVVVIFGDCLVSEALGILCELPLLCILKVLEDVCTLKKPLVLPCERCDLAWYAWIKDKVNRSLRCGLDPADLLLLLHLDFICFLDVFLGHIHLINLSGDKSALEVVTFPFFLMLFINFLEKPLTVVNIQLILETVSELIVFLHLSDAIEKGVLQILLGNS